MDNGETNDINIESNSIYLNVKYSRMVLQYKIGIYNTERWKNTAEMIMVSQGYLSYL